MNKHRSLELRRTCKLTKTDVLFISSECCKCDIKQILSGDRHESISYARRISAYLMHNKMGLSYTEIANFLNVAHSSVSYMITLCKQALYYNSNNKALGRLLRRSFWMVKKCIYGKKKKPFGYSTKTQAQKAQEKINSMMGLPLREGFHIMRVFEENGFWYLSRSL